MLRSDVTNDRLAEIKDAVQIEKLLLPQTGISDEALVHLENLKSLKLLNLRQSQITAESAQRFSAALPNTSILFTGGALGPELNRNESLAQ